MSIVDSLRINMQKVMFEPPPDIRYGSPSPFDFIGAMLGEPKAWIWGMPVYVSPLCVERVPVRKHKDRGDFRRNRLFARSFIVRPSNYHKRIQKKWNKRYGFKDEPIMLLVGRNKIFMHPTVYAKLEQELRR